MSKVIPDLENIIVQYLDIDDYSKIIKYNPKLYSWQKYFAGKLPTIYDAINIYDNLHLVKYIIKKNNKNINYDQIIFRSIPVAKYVTKKIPLSPVEDDMEYESLISETIKSGNPELLKFILGLKIYHLDTTLYYEIFESAFYANVSLENIKILFAFAKENLKYDFANLIAEVYTLADLIASEEIKIYIKFLSSY